jgi:mono/diheme cytochrome c family protein
MRFHAPHCSSLSTHVMAIASVVLLLCAADASAQTAAPDSSRSATNGAYSAEQATEGETTFRNICGSCHGIAEFNSPAFRRTWSGRPVFALFDQLRASMPLDNPGGLSREQYAAVIAYVLKLNQYPAGASALPVADSALKRITF